MADVQKSSGPAVWLDMDQAALDAAYNQSVWAPNQEAVHARRAVLAQECYERRKPQRHRYGDTDIEGFDFYPAGNAKAPVRIFIHGGAWRSGDARAGAHLADTFCGAGAHFISMDFINIDDAKGDLQTVARQVRDGIAWIYKNAEKLNIDRSQFYISGHSSGGHLGGCVLVTDWQGDYDLPADMLSGAILCSGMYDLEPVALSARSKYVNFTPETVQRLSAIGHLDRVLCPVVLGYGTLESPEFQRQSEAFVAALRSSGKEVELIVAEGVNHFEMLEALHNPYGLYGRAALRQMGL